MNLNPISITTLNTASSRTITLVHKFLYCYNLWPPFAGVESSVHHLAQNEVGLKKNGWHFTTLKCGARPTEQDACRTVNDSVDNIFLNLGVSHFVASVFGSCKETR